MWLVIIGIVVGVLVVAVLAVVAVGATLPKHHVAARRVTVPADPVQVWAALTDVAAYPSWRPRVRGVEVLGTDPLRWRETGRDGAITFELAGADEPRGLTTRITDESLPFGGTWTYRLAPAANGTTVTVTEHGEVRNPLFRFVSRFVMGHTATIDAYLTALGTRFGHAVTPQTAEA
jgi:uncharacterized protein YndB with AHSA1/START domain